MEPPILSVNSQPPHPPGTIISQNFLLADNGGAGYQASAEIAD